MAFLKELQVLEILKHMSSDESVLSIKYKAKNSPTDNVTVPHAEREAYESLGYSVTNTLKTKVKMSRPKKSGAEVRR